MPDTCMGTTEALKCIEARSVLSCRPGNCRPAIDVPIVTLVTTMVIAGVISAVRAIRFILVGVHIFLADHVYFARSIENFFDRDFRAEKINACLTLLAGKLKKIWIVEQRVAFRWQYVFVP